MKLRSRIINGSDNEKTKIVKNNSIKENVIKRDQEDNDINKRKRLRDENSIKNVLEERSNKVVKLDKQQTIPPNKSKNLKEFQHNGKRNSIKRKRTSSTSKNNSHKKIKLDLDVNDINTLINYPVGETFITTKDLYGFLFTDNVKIDADNVFNEDRLHTLLEKEKDLPTSPVIDYCSPSKEGELKTRFNYQCAIVNIVIDKFHYRAETGLLAMAIFDDCWRQRLVNSNNSKILAITSVYIAAKYEEVRVPSIDELISYVSPSCNKDDITKAEIFILNAIDFNVIRPLSIEISRCFALGLKYPEKGNFILDYICFVVAADNRTAHLKPSTIASCAVMIACELFNIPPDSKRLSLMKKITKDEFSKILTGICNVVIENLSLFSHSDSSKKYNGINAAFDKKKYDKSTRYFHSKLPHLIGFYEDLTEKSK